MFSSINPSYLQNLTASTRKVLNFLEEIKSNTCSKDYYHSDSHVHYHTYSRQNDCSVYRKLTRKCYCFDQAEYSDFLIHFNEESKYLNSTVGEIIKNMRILKIYLYMGGDYARNGLKFLNEGLQTATHDQKIEIIQGCSNADVCNIFEDPSIVIALMSNDEHYGDSKTQVMVATFLLKLSEIEEGRRYLNYSTKITMDIKQAMRQKPTPLEFRTLQILNEILNLLIMPQNNNIQEITFYSTPLSKPSETIFNKFLTKRSKISLQFTD